ncbi:MAG TPA: hypothetical protein VFT22_12280 [Kofleriaceae bacterium]|nr:hypothetical protein [Kofleriaceae bacterium]
MANKDRPHGAVGDRDIDVRTTVDLDGVSGSNSMRTHDDPRYVQFRIQLQRWVAKLENRAARGTARHMVPGSRRSGDDSWPGVSGVHGSPRLHTLYSDTKR